MIYVLQFTILLSSFVFDWSKFSHSSLIPVHMVSEKETISLEQSEYHFSRSMGYNATQENECFTLHVKKCVYDYISKYANILFKALIVVSLLVSLVVSLVVTLIVYDNLRVIWCNLSEWNNNTIYTINVSHLQYDIVIRYNISVNQYNVFSLKILTSSILRIWVQWTKCLNKKLILRGWNLNDDKTYIS